MSGEHSLSGTVGSELFRDDFIGGLATEGTDARWRLRPTDSVPGGDGIVRHDSNGLVVESSGRHKVTGDPAFTFASTDGDDHLKWTALPRQTAPSGVAGFEAPSSGLLTGTASMSTRVFGATRHPFGDAVADSDTDPRLAAGALIAVDPETGLVCDFTLTNGRVYALYERLPGRDPDRASFTYQIPVGDRVPDQEHKLTISYSRENGTASWWLDGEAVLWVERLGRRALPDKYLVIDHGGADEDVLPRQFTFGLAMFTLLDATGPDGCGLVRLSGRPGAYAATRNGMEPSFVDEAGERSSRLWGQGVRMRVRRYEVRTATVVDRGSE